MVVWFGQGGNCAQFSRLSGRQVLVEQPGPLRSVAKSFNMHRSIPLLKTSQNQIIESFGIRNGPVVEEHPILSYCSANSGNSRGPWDAMDHFSVIAEHVRREKVGLGVIARRNTVLSIAVVELGTFMPPRLRENGRKRAGEATQEGVVPGAVPEEVSEKNKSHGSDTTAFLGVPCLIRWGRVWGRGIHC